MEMLKVWGQIKTEERESYTKEIGSYRVDEDKIAKDRREKG